jgi:two-component system, cell cycle response regulator
MASNTTALAEKRRTLRVLVVDTSPGDARRIRELLGEHGGFLTTIARSTAEAVDLLGDGSFDVVLVAHEIWNDYESGVARLLRDERSDAAVLVLTASAGDREAPAALKLGAEDFLTKLQASDRGQLSARILAAYDENRSLRRRDTMVRWLEREARTDHLTGLYTRRVFDERLRDVCEEARHSNAPTTLIVANVADTRAVNEAHGYEVGDGMIRRAAQGIARCVRGTDFAARVAGDDFGVILAGADLELGKLITRRIAQETERLNASDWRHLVPVTLTFGVATGSNCQPGELFLAADRAMTDNKNSRALVTMLWPRIDTNGPSVA